MSLLVDGMGENADWMSRGWSDVVINWMWRKGINHFLYILRSTVTAQAFTNTAVIPISPA